MFTVAVVLGTGGMVDAQQLAASEGSGTWPGRGRRPRGHQRRGDVRPVPVGVTEPVP
jgi:hypothetical protein